ncbi:MAG: ABC transporter ATP-binding protein [Pirellulales bacterium]|nr:ABC transporter ATP-binding protein [Pirellulales bacterium]
MPALQLQHLAKIFPGGIRAVEDFSLDAADGERIVLFGPSGCGKTTVLRLIAGLESLTAGSILLDGHPLDRLSPKDRDVAMVFQNSTLYPHLNVRKNLGFGLKLRGAPKAEIERRVAETAAWLGLSDLLDRKPWELSGGQRQRVALGRALVRRPKILLLDEPLTHLDAGLSDQFRREIVRLQETLRVTMIHVTHDLAEAQAIGQRIAFLRDGRIQRIDGPGAIYCGSENECREADHREAGTIG